MAPSTSPYTKVTPDSKDPVIKARKGFLRGLLSRSPQTPTKTVARKRSAPEVRSHTSGSKRDISHIQSPSLIPTQYPPHNKASVNTTIPRCKDHLRELGLTTPVVLTQPRVAGSETVLPRADKVVSHQDMLFNTMRSASGKASCTSSRPRPGRSSREIVRPISDYAVTSEQPVLDITHSDSRLSPLVASTSNSPSSSSGHTSRMAMVEMFEFPRSTVHNTAQDSFSPSPPVSPSSSAPHSPSVSPSHGPSYHYTKRHQRLSSVETEAASRRSRGYVPVEPASLFPVDEGLFGRPKIPPPLKIIPKKKKLHRRNDTTSGSTLPRSPSFECLSKRASHARSQTIHQTPVRPTSQGEPAGYTQIPDSVTPPPLPPLNHVRVRKAHSLSRTNTHVTAESDETEATFVSSRRAKLAWTPPANWSGPSAGDRDSSMKKLLNPLRRVKSSSKLAAPAATKCLHPYLDMPLVTKSFVTTRDDDERLPPMRWKRNSPRVIVKMQDFPGDDLKEAPLQDVISRLRELKSSAM